MVGLPPFPAVAPAPLIPAPAVPAPPPPAPPEYAPLSDTPPPPPYALSENESPAADERPPALPSPSTPLPPAPTVIVSVAGKLAASYIPIVREPPPPAPDAASVPLPPAPDPPAPIISITTTVQVGFVHVAVPGVVNLWNSTTAADGLASVGTVWVWSCRLAKAWEPAAPVAPETINSPPLVLKTATSESVRSAVDAEPGSFAVVYTWAGVPKSTELGIGVTWIVTTSPCPNRAVPLIPFYSR